MTTTKKTELDQWKQAAEDSRNVLAFYEKRADKFKARIRSLEARVRDLTAADGTPEEPLPTTDPEKE